MSFRKFHGSDRYLTNHGLEMAVNTAIALEKPLLVRGEPGTGKTELAVAIAKGLGMPLIRWHVKSTTRAQEGLYTYDTVQRLYDSRFDDTAVHDIRHYIHHGPLGQAFSSDERVVLLIDEVDKADIEFPNDLLNELDRMSFTIPELREEVVAKHRPVVIITSNNEKELPDPFLRRCIFHFIEFPDEELLGRILKVHHPQLEESLSQQALQAFLSLREAPLRKRPSTSELIDWVAALKAAGISSFNLEQLPMLGTLIKKEQDLQLIQERVTRRGHWRN
ncbi:MAG: MoxR family ATPase [Vulcanimicrobiota bacterium]